MNLVTVSLYGNEAMRNGIEPSTVTVPPHWLKSVRISRALADQMKEQEARRKQDPLWQHWEVVDRFQGILPRLEARIAEALRVEARGNNWKSDDLRENYLACILEGTIAIGS